MYNDNVNEYSEIQDKVSNLLKKGFYSEPVYNDKQIKTKINRYNGKTQEDNEF